MTHGARILEQCNELGAISEDRQVLTLDGAAHAGSR
jgi:hypothetical protein